VHRSSSHNAPAPPVDFLVIGAQKAGTSSLWAILQKQPWLLAPPTKELHHFDVVRGWSDETYRAMFPEATTEGQLRGEATPDYLASYEAPGRIRQHNANVRMVVLLRDPVERACSAFLHAQRFGAVSARDSLEAVHFGEARRRVKGAKWARIRWDGMYAHHLQLYLHLFEREQLHVEFFEDFIHDPASVLRRVWRFLGVPGLALEHLPHANPARSSRAPRLTGALHRSRRSLRVRGYRRIAGRLHQLEKRVMSPAPPLELGARVDKKITLDYLPDVIALTHLLGRRPPWPRFQALMPEYI
jgi:hypothetical protein